jgi:2-oxo-4-hydroxy-4-carboxy-5-ureidoimidazoline decarboxylase
VNVKHTLTEVNALEEEEFVALLGGVFEHSPWVARAAWPARPFASADALHAAMTAAVHAAGTDRQRALLAAHPELARRAPLTAVSAAEQARVGLDLLEASEMSRWAELNSTYRARFGFPFVIAVRSQSDQAAILAALAARLEHDEASEIATAIAEVAKIARYRLGDLIAGGAMGGRLTVHVLDTATGGPAVGLSVALFLLDGTERVPLGTWRTNADGRSDGPLLAGAAMAAGVYELVFAVAQWRGAREEDEAGFYDDVPIRFRVRDAGASYHIPLILAPFGYTTYRGS